MTPNNGVQLTLTVRVKLKGLLQMFCPECKAEFIEGIKKCPDCNVDLVEELPPEPKPQFVDYSEILATYNPADIAFLKSVLDSEGITYFFKGENFQHVRPWADPARLMDRTDQVEQVLELIKDLKLSYMGINLNKE
jgi:hypothetical protein